MHDCMHLIGIATKFCRCATEFDQDVYTSGYETSPVAGRAFDLLLKHVAETTDRLLPLNQGRFALLKVKSLSCNNDRRIRPTQEEAFVEFEGTQFVGGSQVDTSTSIHSRTSSR